MQSIKFSFSKNFLYDLSDLSLCAFLIWYQSHISLLHVRYSISAFWILHAVALSLSPYSLIHCRLIHCVSSYLLDSFPSPSYLSVLSSFVGLGIPLFSSPNAMLQETAAITSSVCPSFLRYNFVEYQLPSSTSSLTAFFYKSP